MKKILFTLLVFGLLVGMVYLIYPKAKEETTSITTTDTIRISDTVIVFDTITVSKPVTKYVEIVRIDTVAIIDSIVITVPIEQKTYQTADYKAIIEGYKANLLSLDIYRQKTYIFDTVLINNATTITKIKNPRFALSLGPGIGYAPKGFQPYVGVHVGWVIWSR